VPCWWALIRFVLSSSGLQRCGKSCRLRWINYLRPDLKRGTFSLLEENLIIELHAVLGNRYSHFPLLVAPHFEYLLFSHGS